MCANGGSTFLPLGNLHSILAVADPGFLCMLNLSSGAWDLDETYEE